MTCARLYRAYVLAVAIIVGIAVTLPPDTASARDWRGGGHKAMGLSSGDRAKLRRHIISKHHRPGRPVDPGFGRPRPGHQSSIRDKIRKEIRKDMRRRFVGKLVAGVVL